MTVLVDMDDTIEQLLKAWVAGVNARYGTDARVEDVTDWDVSRAFPSLDFRQVYSVPLQAGFWKTVEPIPGAAEALKALMDAGHEVFIVTATPPETAAEKMRDVLFRYFPFLTLEQLIITFRKQQIRGDVMIDDGPHNLEGGPWRKILMSAPHNRSYDAAAHGMERVENWDEVLALLGVTKEPEA